MTGNVGINSCLRKCARRYCFQWRPKHQPLSEINSMVVQGATAVYVRQKVLTLLVLNVMFRKFIYSYPTYNSHILKFWKKKVEWTVQTGMIKLFWPQNLSRSLCIKAILTPAPHRKSRHEGDFDPSVSPISTWGDFDPSASYKISVWRQRISFGAL
jgi:hypothetical protein